MEVSEEQSFEALLEYVKQSRGFDFTGYKRSSLMRRVNKRMQTVNIEGYDRYRDFLEAHPGEFSSFFNTLLINVTSFFRDRPAWDYIASEIVPLMLAHKREDEVIRVWSAGCASGQEVYTIAMVLAEALGLEQFCSRVKIYATDVDEEALSQARQATYSEEELAGVAAEQIERFFERTESGYTFRKDLRRAIIFGRHDLIQDAPISKIDLLLCRNTLMYFNAETQRRILSTFHFAVQDNGFLFLGKAEMLLSHTSLFTPMQLKCRVFAKVAGLNQRGRRLLMAYTNQEEVELYVSNQVRLKETAFDTAPFAHVIIDANGELVQANELARSYFRLTNQDIGRPLQDLEISYRPVELRSRIELAYKERRLVELQNVVWQVSHEESRYLNVRVLPLVTSNSVVLGASIHFIETTAYKQLQDQLEHSNQELEMAYEELQSTNEELETTNEELQSSNEELETTNEELQSTNEELETMNEELQSANEELQTVNEELQQRSTDLDQINAFLAAILTSLRGGVVVVNPMFQVLMWNRKAEDLWGLRAEEVINQNFLTLDIGLPVEQLRQPIRDSLAGLASANDSTDHVLEAVNRRGRRISCRVTCNPLMGSDGHVQGVILLMEDVSEDEGGKI